MKPEKLKQKLILSKTSYFEDEIWIEIHLYQETPKSQNQSKADWPFHLFRSNTLLVSRAVARPLMVVEREEKPERPQAMNGM